MTLPTLMAIAKTMAMRKTMNDEMAFIFVAVPYFIIENIDTVSTSSIPLTKCAQMKSSNKQIHANRKPAPTAGATMGSVISR